MQGGKRSEKIAVVGFPTEWGHIDRAGSVSAAPAYLRKAGIMAALSVPGTRLITDIGDVYCGNAAGAVRGSADIVRTVVGLSARVRDTVADLLVHGNRVLAVGGDHSMAMGTVAGAATAYAGRIGLVWIDAHADSNTLDVSLSDNIHGMPLAYLTGVSGDPLDGILDSANRISPTDVALIGVNDIEDAERIIVSGRGIRAFDMFALRRGRGDTLDTSPAKAAIDEISARYGRLWISLDIDGIDADDAPATPMRNRRTGAWRGLPGAAVLDIVAYAAARADILGMDIAEFMPANEIDGKTTDLVFRLVRTAFSGNPPATEVT